jgi:hypothetical protein
MSNLGIDEINKLIDVLKGTALSLSSIDLEVITAQAKDIDAIEAITVFQNVGQAVIDVIDAIKSETPDAETGEIVPVKSSFDLSTIAEIGKAFIQGIAVIKTGNPFAIIKLLLSLKF